MIINLVKIDIKHKKCMDMEELLSARHAYVTFFLVMNCLLR